MISTPEKLVWAVSVGEMMAKVAGVGAARRVAAFVSKRGTTTAGYPTRGPTLVTKRRGGLLSTVSPVGPRSNLPVRPTPLGPSPMSVVKPKITPEMRQFAQQVTGRATPTPTQPATVRARPSAGRILPPGARPAGRVQFHPTSSGSRMGPQ